LKEKKTVTSDSSSDCSKPEINILIWFNMVHKLQQKSRFTDYIQHFFTATQMAHKETWSSWVRLRLRSSPFFTAPTPASASVRFTN